MPTLSASDYTTFLKLQAAQQSYANNQVPRKIQTTDQAVPNVNILNSYLKTSQAAYVVNASQTNLTGLNYVRAVPVVQTRNNPNALSTITYTTGTVIPQPGGIPANRPGVSTYTRLPQNAGWANGNQTQS
jgi:hypothetical protein